MAKGKAKTKRQSFEIDGHDVGIDVPILYAARHLFVISDKTVARYSPFPHFLFAGADPISGRIGAAALGTYGCLLVHMDWETHLTNISQERLAAETNQTEKTLRKYLRVLEGEGLIVQLPRFKGLSPGVCDWYYLNEPVAEAPAPKPRRTKKFADPQGTPVNITGVNITGVEITGVPGELLPETPVNNTGILYSSTSNTTTTAHQQQQLFDLFVKSKPERARHAAKQPAQLRRWICERLKEYDRGDIAGAIRNEKAGWADHWGGLDDVLRAGYTTRQEKTARQWENLDAERRKFTKTRDDYVDTLARRRERGIADNVEMVKMAERYSAEVAAIEEKLRALGPAREKAAADR